MKSLPAAAAALALLAAHPALAQSVNSSGGAGDRSDSRFVDHVARDGQAEIDLAHLASKKTQNTEVKALARRLAADHTKANQQLMKIAQKEGMSPAGSESKSASKEQVGKQGARKARKARRASLRPSLREGSRAGPS
jgi:predicted outer membrane protein